MSRATGAGGRGQGAGGADQKKARAQADAAVDALFQLPLSEFTAAHNALAARLRKTGRPDDAAAVQALPKPSISAWAVNQIYWNHRAAFDRLIATGERFYRAQRAQLSGEPPDLRNSLDSRREALSELSRLAAASLREAGHNPTPEMMRRITTTLEALSTYTSAGSAPQGGRLTDDVAPPGFEVLAPLVSRMGEPAQPDGPSRLLPFRQQTRATPRPRRTLSPDEEARQREEERQAARAAATRAVEEATQRVRDARAAARQAEAALKQAAARAKNTEREKAAAEQRYADAMAAAEEAHTSARRVATEAEEAAQALDEAERTLEQAKSALETL